MTAITSTYLTQDDFTARFEDIATQFDDATIAAALVDANGLAFGYVGAMYPTLDPIPGLLKGAVADICRRKLFKFEPPAGVTELYQEAMKTLREIASGVVQLVIVADTTEDDGESLVFSGSATRVCSAAQLGYWQPNCDQDD